MHTHARHHRLTATLAAGLLLFVGGPASAADTESIATKAAWWIEAQFTDEGSVIGRTGVPDVPNTIAATLGILATGHRPSTLEGTVAYVEAGLDDYVAGAFVDDYGPAGSGDRPGALANLLWFAQEVGLDPTDFGGSDVVARLAATEQTIGPDAGSFGRQVDVFGHGYAHATIVLALAVSDATGPSPASVDHLLDLQCGTGGFPSGYRTAAQRVTDDCTGDSNATGLALAALAHLEGHESSIGAAVAFLAGVVNEDGGWGYTPGDPTDGNSTGLAAMGLRLAGEDVTQALDAIAALQFDCTSATEQIGGVRFVASDDVANSFSTYQAMLAMDREGAATPADPCAGKASAATVAPAPDHAAASEPSSAPTLPVTGGGGAAAAAAVALLGLGRRRRR